LTLMATVMLGFLSAFLQSRRVTESSVLHAAASSLMYGIVEQIKGLAYTELLPSISEDDDAPADVRDKPPYKRIRILYACARCADGTHHESRHHGQGGGYWRHR
jgi:hypothetical protein